MEVILLERIENLGLMGDVVNVKPGYARNFLLPQKKALRATEESRRLFEEQRGQLEASNLESRKEAEAVAKKLDGLSVVLVRQAGEAGQLYGSVNARDVADEVSAAGFTVDKNQVRLTKPIKSVGLHEILVDLHPEVSVTVISNVARSSEEAETQAKTGRAVVGIGEEQPEEVAERKTKDKKDKSRADAEADDETKADAEAGDETKEEGEPASEADGKAEPGEEAKQEN